MTETALLKLTLTSKCKGEMTEWASCVVLRGGEMSGSTVLREFSSGTWRSETESEKLSFHIFLGKNVYQIVSKKYKIIIQRKKH